MQYVRDTKGRVTSVRTRADSSVTSWTVIAPALKYEPFGPLTTMNLANGLRAVNDWGDDGRLASRRLFRPTDSTNLSRLTYVYDADDNIVRINDTVDATKTQKFVYDAAGRLTRLDVATGAIQRTNWTYDNNGNRLREQRRALASDATPLESDVYTTTAVTNRLASLATPAGTRAITYDARGNTAGEQAKILAFTAAQLPRHRGRRDSTAAMVTAAVEALGALLQAPPRLSKMYLGPGALAPA